MNVFLFGKNRSLQLWQLYTTPKFNYFQQQALTLARLCVCLAIVCLPFSHFLVNQFTFVAAIFAVFAGDWKEKWQYVAKFPFIWWSFAFILILIVGILYSEASFGKAATGFSKYNKIIFILFFLPLFRTYHWRNYAIHCLIYSLAFAEFISILGDFNLLDIMTWVQAHPHLFPQVERSFSNIIILLIPFSALSAFVGFLLLHLIAEKRNKPIYLCLFSLNTYHLLFISGERTGYYSFILLSLLFLLQRLGLRKGILFSMFIIPALILSFYHFIPQFQGKSNLLVSEINNYQHGDYDSSIGYRLGFAHDSFKLIKANPILGVGTGGFIPAYHRINGVVNQGRTSLSDPHNDYIYILVEIGVLGLSIFLLWLISLLIFTLKLPKPQQWLAQGLVISFMFNSVTNATLILPPTGFLLILFISIFFASAADL